MSVVPDTADASGNLKNSAYPMFASSRSAVALCLKNVNADEFTAFHSGKILERQLAS